MTDSTCTTVYLNGSSNAFHNDQHHTNEKDHQRRNTSIIILKPKRLKKQMSSQRSLGYMDVLESTDGLSDPMLSHHRHLHPVKVGRYKLNKNDREKFIRMKKDGRTSLSIAVQSSDKSDKTLGQLIGKKYVKPSPIKIITEETFKQLEMMKEADQSQFTDYIVDRDKSLTMINVDQCSVSHHQDPVDTPHGPIIDFHQLRSLQNLGIDVGFIDYYQREFLLESAGKLLVDLMEEQNRRLSSLKRVQSYREKSLASSVLSLLTYLCKTFAPGDLASTSVIHNILGINI